MLRKGLGFAEKLVLARYGGTSGTMDVWFLVFGVAFALYVLVDDIVAPVFLPRYQHLRARCGAQVATRSLRRVFGLTAAFLGVAVVAVLLNLDAVLDHAAPGFSPARRAQAVPLLRWALPAGLLMGLAALTYVALNARGQFAWPAAAAVAFKAVVVGGLVLAWPSMGLTGAGVALFVAAAVQLTLHLVALRAPAATLTSSDGPPPPNPWLMALPLILGTVAAQSSGLIDNAVASTLEEGAVAALGFARRLVDLPVLFVAGAVGIVAFPRLAARAAADDPEALFADIGRLAAVLALLFLPAFALIAPWSELLVRLAFARGAFGTDSVAATAQLLTILALGLPAFALEILLLRAWYAVLDTFTPVLIGLLFVALNITLTVSLAPHLGVVAIALALVVQKSGKVIVLAVRLRRHGRLPTGSGAVAARIVFAAAVFAAISGAGAALSGQMLGAFLLTALGATLVYGALLRRLGVLDPTGLLNALRRGGS